MEIIETNLEFKSNISKMGNVNGIVLHHTGVTVEQSVEVIHNYHKNHNGWAGIGYHYYVRKDGSIYKGRSEEYAGAHCPGVNSSSIGICAEGNFNEETMPEAQKNAIIELVNYLKAKYNITVVQAHRQVCATNCPGAKYPFDDIVNSRVENIEEGQVTTSQEENVVKGNVATIQTYLNSKYGFNLVVDNIYGNKTKSALVKALQKEIGVTTDGIFGPVTKSHCPNIKTGSTGIIVRLTQAMLVCHIFDIAVDGDFKEKTDTAVKEFQRRNGLLVDGIVGKNTFNCLFK